MTALSVSAAARAARPLSLRPYQLEALAAVEEAFAGGRNAVLVTLPTGAGKTIMFAALAERMLPGRTVILAHREELIAQARDKVRAVTGIVAGVEMAQQRAAASDPIVIASIATLARGREIAGERFALCVVDEAHHVMADSYRRVLDALAPACLLGVTATPYRGDKQRLSGVFEDGVYALNILDLIRQGHLADVQVRTLSVKIDLSEVRIRQGDFSEADLGGALAPMLGRLADIIASEYADRKLLTFCPLRDTSRLWTNELLARDLPAEHIDGDSLDRADILRRFARGKTRFLSNASLLTEGYDEPTINALLVLRPTRSRGLFAQMIGRGTRLAPGKDRLLVLDPLFVGEKHDVLSVADLAAEDDAEGKRIAQAMREGMDLTEAVEHAAEQQRQALAQALASHAHRSPYERGLAELAFALDHERLQAWEPTFAWHREPPTEKQIAMLNRAGVDRSLAGCKGLASEIIKRIIARRSDGMATFKQVSFMRRRGHPAPERATFDEAREWISRRW